MYPHKDLHPVLLSCLLFRFPGCHSVKGSIATLFWCIWWCAVPRFLWTDFPVKRTSQRDSPVKRTSQRGSPCQDPAGNRTTRRSDHCLSSSHLSSRRTLISYNINLRILCENYLQHQQDLYHVFVDLKKAFDRILHAALWATMKKYNISTNLIRVIKNLYDKATGAVLFNNNIEDWFLTTVGFWQGCLLSPTLFNIFLERIMTDALEDFS